MTSRGLSDMQVAAELARNAVTVLLKLRDTEHDLAPAELKDRGDAASQALLARGLAAGRPRDAVLSEEAVDDKCRVSAPRVWIIDPLDGTREYSEGRHDWAVHVALWESGELKLGAVGLSRPRTVLVSDPAPLVPEKKSKIALRMAVSRSRPPTIASVAAAQMGAELVPMGSAGFKVAAVVQGEVDMYVHAGGQYEWDSAAPVAVALAAGLHASRLDGSPLIYNRANPHLPDLVVCRKELAPRLLEVIRCHSQQGENS